MRNRRLVRIAVAGSVIALLGGGTLVARHYLSRQAGPGGESASALQEVASAPAPAASAHVVDPALPLPSAPLAAAPQMEPAPRAAGRHERPFGRAPSFGDALLRAGLSADETNEVIGALTGILDFRRAHPSDVLVIDRGGDTQLARFEYRAGPTLRYEATRDEGGRLVGREVQLPIETVRVARGGEVEGSLGDALEGLSLGRALTGVFADVFKGRVDFSTDTRRGDAFRVLLDEEYVEGTRLRFGTIHALEYRGAKVGTLRAFWHESKQTEGDFFDEEGRALHGGWLRTPVLYDRISSGYGMRFHPVLKRKRFHRGIDYVASLGTPIRAAAAGTVRFAGPKGANGNLLALSHGQGYETFYAHLARFAPGIKPGASVKQRQVVAYVGSTGRSTGPHLHFALKRGGQFIDPNSQLNGPGLPLPARELPEFKQRVHALLDTLAHIPLERPAPVASSPTPEGPLDLDDDAL